MTEDRKWDRKLGIRTGGRDASLGDEHHLPYEPTPYAVLERLAASGWIGGENLLLDYGCGKGRVSLFLCRAVGCRTMGIDFNPAMTEEAERNRLAMGAGERVRFLTENAARFTPPAAADRFYFFNPFSLETLQSCLARIAQSQYDAPRPVRLIFYYPSDDYLRFLMNEDGLTLTDELDLADLFPGDRRERLLCFSSDE